MGQAPGPELARTLAAQALGVPTVSAERFSVGLRHFVYEVQLASGGPVVVRISREADRHVCKSAARLSAILRPAGVPLPELIFDGSRAATPFLILERLAGYDLGFVASALPGACLSGIAGKLAAAQAVVMSLPSAGLYGYASAPTEAPFARWSQVLWAHLDRIGAQLSSAGIYSDAVAARCAELLRKVEGEADQLAATPFLHDTTTKNVIVTAEGEFSGIVDVDDLCYGDPRRVAALTLASLMSDGKRGPVDYVETWMRHARWTDDRLFRVYVALYLADFMSEHGHSFNDNQRSPRAEEIVALEETFARAAAAAD
jgi:aminoglycoside phosphotransferase (APT) family kinase protein